MEIIGEIFGEILFRFLLLPILMIVATPILLVCACFGKADYYTNLSRSYESLFDMWTYSWLA